MGPYRARASAIVNHPLRIASVYIPRLLLAISAAMLLVHTLAGRHIVNAVYDGPLTPWLGDVLEGRRLHDADHYYRALTQRLPHAVIGLGALALALMCATAFRRRRWPTVPFAVDFLLIAIACSFRARGFMPGPFSVNVDWGYPEMFQYTKEAVIVMAHIVLYRRLRTPTYLVWSGVFLYLLLDDSLQIHERLAETLAAWAMSQGHVSLLFGLRPRDIGEVLVAGTVATFILVAVVLTYGRASSIDRRTTRSLVGLLGLLGGFGVALDAASMAVSSWWLGFFSDTGEMFALSAATSYLLVRLRQPVELVVVPILVPNDSAVPRAGQRLSA
jgi:hypothetical protein